MDSSKFKKIALIGILVTIGTFSCTGQSRKERPENPPSVDEVFEHMDANEDGLLSKKEVRGPLKHDFDEIDENEDGFISKEELEKAPKPKRKKTQNRDR